MEYSSSQVLYILWLWTIKIKADGYGKYAEDAVELSKKLVSDKKTPPLLEPIIIGE